MDSKNLNVINKIDSYNGDITYLGRLISDLDAIWELHVEWPEEKRREFMSAWGVLEQIYAEALDKQYDALSEPDVLDSRIALNFIKEQLIDNSSTR